MPFTKGQAKTGGRPKGSANVITREIGELVIQAMQEEGGIAYMRRQARENPKIFGALLAKCIPQAVEVSDDFANLPTVTFNFAGRPVNGDDE